MVTFILDQFRVHIKVESKAHRFPHIPLTKTHWLPHYQNDYENYVFVTKDEPALIHQDYPE